jgi:hypothetical protein
MRRRNRREVSSRAETDRRRFLGWVAEMPERFGLEMRAFGLMNNQVGAGAAAQAVRRFPTTLGNVITLACDTRSPDAQSALGSLCQAYLHDSLFSKDLADGHVLMGERVSTRAAADT